ncbi:Rho-binding antiterminator (plasmid) [Photobacterium sp. GJ3]|uniref:Rho-binding antiterminator n=1 Tax=Photobacterium sp. GJ3 TaxID=2829502 RepID=UPI001B8BFCC3|nr:Rho-binding antiterminator [Photobacterium sp. GJ3]QUJ70421.1 Rho-binding antiterminator [Photobacterium sp. GJ3]
MISCQQYDYIEIACLYTLPVRLTLNNGQQIEGHAKDTLRNSDRQECLSLQTSRGLQIVVLDELVRMEATQPNVHFDVIEF